MGVVAADARHFFPSLSLSLSPFIPRIRPSFPSAPSKPIPSSAGSNQYLASATQHPRSSYQTDILYRKNDSHLNGYYTSPSCLLQKKKTRPF